jgi:hypothetical protein
MRLLCVALAVAMVSAVLVGCGGAQGTQTPSGEEAGVEVYASEALDTSYDGALAASGQLAFGTLRLAETEQAVTAEQAKKLLPLWQALRGGVTADAEVNAVLRQIEGAMTSDQLEAIAAMQLTQEDLGNWMQEQGTGFGRGFAGGGGQGEVSEEERATRQAQFAEGQGGEIPPEMATRRAEFGSMSDEEREALRATMQAGGNPFGEGGGRPGGAGGPGAGGFGGARQYMVFLQPLIELLDGLAGE